MSKLRIESITTAKSTCLGDRGRALSCECLKKNKYRSNIKVLNMCHIVSISMTSSLINNQDCELLTT